MSEPMTDQPRQNIEVKARYPDLASAREVCQRIGARFVGVLNQIDTYFRTNDGSRQKIRQINDTHAELITYSRPNDAVARSSLYTVEPLADVQATLAALAGKLGVLCVVRKHRELFGWHNVRIHLDEVEGLGSFIEFEGVVGAVADENVSRERVDRLVAEFAIGPGDQIGVSYSDLLLAASGETSR
jgi:predicted adenylyl cyclase CyaB